MQNFFFHLSNRAISDILLKFIVVESSRYGESDEKILVQIFSHYQLNKIKFYLQKSKLYAVKNLMKIVITSNNEDVNIF